MGTPSREDLVRLEEALRSAATANTAAADAVRSLMSGDTESGVETASAPLAIKPTRRAARAPYVPQSGAVDEVTQRRVRKELQRRGMVSLVGKR